MFKLKIFISLTKNYIQFGSQYQDSKILMLHNYKKNNREKSEHFITNIKL